ncbi:hypothetical protein HJ01_02351 [Flavobacterium frigoris PS1]|uniref:Uncharacterized protein n=1 Tax=Flavobacterium frigoris (strain PS1) TaxID=1086011 RepID=H7FSS0_FLAFP|nr:hypothetical protein HJ01_02351 [Flavobacterium frigoris PS1]
MSNQDKRKIILIIHKDTVIAGEAQFFATFLIQEKSKDLISRSQ